MKRRKLIKSNLLIPAIAVIPNFVNGKNFNSKPFKVEAGKARNGKSLKIGQGILDSKISGKDTEGNLFVFESSQNSREEGIPIHMHPDIDETFYVLEGTVKFQIGEDVYYLKPGDTVFAPRNIPHAWVTNSKTASKILIIVQGAGKMEAFFEELANLKEFTPPVVAEIYTKHNMVLIGPPLMAD
jgi:quercetin dioxygenase-like cupin family protein